MEAYSFIVTFYYYFKKLIHIKQKSIQIDQKFTKWIKEIQFIMLIL